MLFKLGHQALDVILVILALLASMQSALKVGQFSSRLQQQLCLSSS